MERAIGRIGAVVGGLLLVVVLVGGAVALGIVGAPSVQEVQNRFAGVNNETTTIRTDLIVTNPNPIGVQLGGVSINYTAELNGVHFISATTGFAVGEGGVLLSTADGGASWTSRTLPAEDLEAIAFNPSAMSVS